MGLESRKKFTVGPLLDCEGRVGAFEAAVQGGPQGACVGGEWGGRACWAIALR